MMPARADCHGSAEADLLPFKPGDWAARIGDHGMVARVRNVYRVGQEVLLDLVLYGADGQRIGRVSPPMGGPTGYEPACEASAWERISRPVFPLGVSWVPTGDGRRVARLYAGPALPPRRAQARQVAVRKTPESDALRDALRQIAEGHNDPRTLAKSVLGYPLS